MKLIVALIPAIAALLFFLSSPWLIKKQAIKEGFQERDIGLIHTGMLWTAIALTMSYLLLVVLECLVSNLGATILFFTHFN